MKAGKARMHTLALRAFVAWLNEQSYSDDEKQLHELRFRELLNASVPAERKTK